jgi:hypothetical protein
MKIGPILATGRMRTHAIKTGSGRVVRFMDKPHSIVKNLNNLLLLAGVVHFNPVPVRVSKIDLLDPIWPDFNCARCALQVFVGDARLC